MSEHFRVQENLLDMLSEKIKLVFYKTFVLFLEMSCTIEKALADAKALVERLREHDNAAEALIEQTTALNKRVEAMKQVESCIQKITMR